MTNNYRTTYLSLGRFTKRKKTNCFDQIKYIFSYLQDIHSRLCPERIFFFFFFTALLLRYFVIYYVPHRNGKRITRIYLSADTIWNNVISTSTYRSRASFEFYAPDTIVRFKDFKNVCKSVSNKFFKVICRSFYIIVYIQRYNDDKTTKISLKKSEWVELAKYFTVYIPATYLRVYIIHNVD